MIARLIDTATSLLVYFLAGTLAAELIVAAYLWSAWHMDGGRLRRILAVAQGAELAAVATDVQAKADQVPPEEVSREEVVVRRAQLYRDLEVRELALNNAVADLAARQQELAEQQAQQRARTQQFESQLKSVEEGAQAEGREVVRTTLQSLKPAQAKEQLFAMLDAGELDEVVLLLAGMPSSNRAKILAEFKTPEENNRLSEILRRIRQGSPETGAADQAMKQPDQTGSTRR